MKIRDQIEYAAVAGLLSFCRMLPETCIYGLFNALGRLSYALLAGRRTLALQNIAIAFPDMAQTERKRIIRKNFAIMAESMALNMLIMSGRISNERLQDMVVAEGWEQIEREIEKTSLGILGVSAHIGNWELMPQYMALQTNRPIHVIARKTSNALLEERIVRPLRERFGVNIFYKKNAVMKLVKAIKGGGITGLMIDQRLNAREGIPVRFFSRDTGTTTTPAVLQIRFGFTVTPSFMVRTGPRKYRFIVGEPMRWNDNGKPMEEQVRELTCIHQKIIENMIRQYPEQWFWVHDRWGLEQQKKRQKKKKKKS